jgi:hypothetical protein
VKQVDADEIGNLSRFAAGFVRNAGFSSGKK